MENYEEYVETESEVIETSIIEGEMVDFYFDKFLEENDNFEHFPYLKKFHLEDLYNIYYSKKYNYVSGDATWTNILSKFDKTLFKFLTNHDSNYCERLVPIFYKHVNNIYKQIEEDKQNEEKENSSNGSSNNDSGSDNRPPSAENKQENSNQSLSEDALNNMVEEAMKEAKKEVTKQQKEEKKEQKRPIILGSSKDGDIDHKEADPQIVMDLLKKVDLKTNAVDEFVKKTIKSFREHFSNVSKFEIEALLEAEEMSDIDGIELIPFVNKFPFLWDEIYNINKIHNCVVDVFCDYSGSMGSYANINSNYNSFTRSGGNAFMVKMVNLAKVLVYKLYQQKYVADIYRFEHFCEKIDINKSLTLDENGGTNIDNVINIIKTTNRPSLVITDMEDNIEEYSNLVYIINLSPGSFERMVSNSNGAIKKMIDNNQIIAFIDNKFLTKEQYYKYKK